jgi:beta-galactosidase
MLDHQGRKDPTFDETAQVYAELARLAPVIDATQFVAHAAILYSDEIGWAWNHIVSTRLRPMLARCDVSMQGRLLRWYLPLYRKKVSTDVINPLRDLSGYKVVVVPTLYLIHPQIVENLERYVRQGGLLIVGPKAGLKNAHNVFFSDVPPCGGLADVFGTTVHPAPLRLGRAEMPVQRVIFARDAPFASGKRFVNEGLFDCLEPTQADTLARHEDGSAAITLNRYGEGLAMVVGCQPQEGFYARLVEWLIDIGRLDPVLRTDADVEVTMRAGGGHRLIFVLNHNPEPVQIVLENDYRELISDQTVSGMLEVGGQDVKILSDPSVGP